MNRQELESQRDNLKNLFDQSVSQQTSFQNGLDAINVKLMELESIESEKKSISPIHLRNTPPPMETFDHPAFLEMFFTWLKPERYLELGVRDGNCFNRVVPLCKHSIGVDTIPPRISVSENVEYYQMNTDDYFKQLDPSIMFDAVFIDADHSHAQSLKDFINVKDKVVVDGFIFLHDTYPYDRSLFSPQLCNDVYRTALHIKENYYSEFEYITLPFNPGFTILKKMDHSKQLIYK